MRNYRKGKSPAEKSEVKTWETRASFGSKDVERENKNNESGCFQIENDKTCFPECANNFFSKTFQFLIKIPVSRIKIRLFWKMSIFEYVLPSFSDFDAAGDGKPKRSLETDVLDLFRSTFMH